MDVLYLFWFLCLFGVAFPFLLDNGPQNVTGTLTDHSYNNLIQLLVDEKASRHQLEDKLDASQHQIEDKLDILGRRLDAIDQSYRDVKVQIDKDKNSREASMQKFAAIDQQLRNLTTTKDQLMTLVTAEKDALQRFQTNLSDVQLLLNERLTNLTKNFHSTVLQIGFAVYHPDKTQHDNGGPIKFKTVHFNSDNLYNTSTGLVTCTIAGLYQFITTIVREPGITEAYCQMMKNNDDLPGVATVGYGSSSNGYASGTTHIILHMNTSDTVYLGDCSGVDHMHWSSAFQGFLIAPDAL